MDCINVTDNEVIVQVTDYIKHDGYTQHLGPLYRTLHSLRDQIKSRRIRFLFREAEPIIMVSFDNVIKNIAETYGLTKDRIILQTIDHVPLYQTDFATVEIKPSSSLDLARQLINVDLCKVNLQSPLFGAFFGRFTVHRFLMAYFLETKIKDQSVVAFHPSLEWAEYDFESVKKYYVRELEWLRNRQEVNANLESGFRGSISSFDSLPIYHELFDKYRIEVVIETNVYECGWFTEKTAKCLAAGKPFLLLGTQGQLAELHRLGFKTFDPWINENYDLESNPECRFDMIKEEIARLSALPVNELHIVLDNMDQIAEYNKKNYSLLLDRYLLGKA